MIPNLKLKSMEELDKMVRDPGVEPNLRERALNELAGRELKFYKGSKPGSYGYSVNFPKACYVTV